MNLDRIESVIAVRRMRAACVAVVAVGGGAGLCRNLVRCGLGRLKAVDRDRVEEVNLCRQEHMADHVGRPKVAALGAELARIDPGLRYEGLTRDFCSLTDAELDSHFGDV